MNSKLLPRVSKKTTSEFFSFFPDQGLVISYCLQGYRPIEMSFFRCRASVRKLRNSACLKLIWPLVDRFTDSEVLAPDFKEKLADVARVMQPLVHWYVFWTSKLQVLSESKLNWQFERHDDYHWGGRRRRRRRWGRERGWRRWGGSRVKVREVAVTRSVQLKIMFQCRM